MHCVSKGDKDLRKARHIGAPCYWCLDKMDKELNSARRADMLASHLPEPAMIRHRAGKKGMSEKEEDD